MKLINKNLSSMVLFPIVSASILMPTSSIQAATLVPPNAEVAGKTVSEWTAAWWQWAFSQAVPDDAFTDTTGENASVNQSGPVFFVAGTVGGDTNRTFTVPSNKYLLFPLINLSASELDFPELTEQERIDTIVGFADLIDSLVAEIDGVPIDNPFDYRATTPDFFSYEAVENNPFGAPTFFVNGAFADGYYVMIEPLKSGSTTTFTFGGGLSALNFTTGVTATITAVPESSHVVSLIGLGLGVAVYSGMNSLKKKSHA